MLRGKIYGWNGWKKIQIATGGKCYLKYDPKKYDIEYVEGKSAIILRRLRENQVVEIFSD